MSEESSALIPEQGWHCLHLFYRVELALWETLTREERNAAKTELSALVQEVRAMESTQLLTLSMVSPKADLGFMLITPDLNELNRMEKRLTASLGPDILAPVYSYLSMTEESEYTTSDEEYADTLAKEQKLEPGSAEFQAGMETFRERMKHYRHERIYPTLPDWPVV